MATNKEEITMGRDLDRPKSRGNYSPGAGEWCGKRTTCANDGKQCDECFKFSAYKKKKK